MLVNFKYRLVGKASWGIAIDISAERTLVAEPPSDATQLADRLWFSCAERTVPREDVHYFMLGLKVVSEDIEKQREGSGLILITAVDVDYNPTDYQPEGLMPAAACWAAEAFHFPKPEIIGHYNKERRKFMISVKPTADTQADDAGNPAEPTAISLDRLRDARQLLQQGQLGLAAKRAGKVVQMALQGVVRKHVNVQRQPSKVQPASIEDMIVLIGQSKPGGVISPVKKHAVRIGTWYRDLQFGIQPPNQREAEEYLRSAETVVSWANEVVEHDPV
jgi:HEPN domain-containing protein